MSCLHQIIIAEYENDLQNISLSIKYNGIELLPENVNSITKLMAFLEPQPVYSKLIVNNEIMEQV
jgi:hypothetical protein